MNEDEKEKIKEEDIPVEAFKDLDIGRDSGWNMWSIIRIILLVGVAAYFSS